MQSTTAELIRLSHHRWVIPLVATMENGQRFAALRSKLGVDRRTLRRALDSAEEMQLIMSNPGLGHPLRPEYLLTPRGEAVAPGAQRVVQAARKQAGWSELLAKKWSLPVIAAMWTGASRYSDINQELRVASPRAIALALDELTRGGCVRRELAAPGRPTYSVAPIAKRLARWAAHLAEAAMVGGRQLSSSTV